MQTSHRILLLDLLRVAAVLLVMGHHLPPLEKALPAALQPAMLRWEFFGWCGVDLFFVLSGFLISGLLFREYQRYGQIRVWRFLTRRGFKIYPPFYLMILAVIYIQASNANYKALSHSHVLHEIFFLQNYRPGLIDHTWSLAVEEHFYLLLPAILFAMIWWNKGKKNAFRWLPLLCLFVFAGELAARLITARFGPYTDRHNLFPTHLRLDSLLFGVFISYFYHFHNDTTMRFARRFRWVLLAAGLALIYPVCRMYVWDHFVFTYGLTFLYTGFGLILLGGLAFQLPTKGLLSLPLRALGFVGAHSYSIYLWHMPVKIWLPLYLYRWFGIMPSPVHDIWGYVIASFAIGIGMSLLVETPTLALRDWLLPSRSKPLVEKGEEGSGLHTAAGDISLQKRQNDGTPAPIAASQ
ncbi:MAG TPA: acyltransferase [Phycisphaerae bacterium]|nr:acyltransferase [Phycisphaerae bacterium]